MSIWLPHLSGAAEMSKFGTACLGYADNDGHAQGERDRQMFLRHTDEPSITSNDEDNAGRRAGSQAIKSGLQISLVSCEVYEA